MTTLAAFNERIYRLNDDFRLFSAKQYPATPAQIEIYTAQTGQIFPSAFVEFLTHWGMLILEVNEEIWPHPKEFAIAPAWHFNYGFFVFGLSPNPESPSWLNYGNEDNLDEHGQCFFEIAGGGKRAYLQDGEIYIVADEIREKYPENLFAFLINEIDQLEESYREMVKLKRA